MNERARGTIILGAFVVVLVLTVLDGADDGFSVWNWFTVLFSAVMIAYGLALVRGRARR
jgi:hypothetical protein